MNRRTALRTICTLGSSVFLAGLVNRLLADDKDHLTKYKCSQTGAIYFYKDDGRTKQCPDKNHPAHNLDKA